MSGEDWRKEGKCISKPPEASVTESRSRGRGTAWEEELKGLAD